MTQPHITPHQERIAALYHTEAPGILFALARIGTRPEVAEEAVTYAFEQLARRPDVAAQAEPIAWLTAVARSRAQRTQLAEHAPAPEPTGDAPDLMAALRAEQVARPRPRRTPAAQPTDRTPAE